MILRKALASIAARTHIFIRTATNDKLIQLKLRELGEPIILFAESLAERRDRLKHELNARQLTNGMPTSASAAQIASASAAAAVAASDQPTGTSAAAAVDPEEVVYTRGTAELLEARRAIAGFSLRRAKARLDAERVVALSVRHDAATAAAAASATVASGAVASAGEPAAAVVRAKARAAHFSTFSNQASEVGSQRPLSSCALSPDERRVAITDWTGACSVWSVADCKLVRTLSGHTDRAHQVVFHRKARAADSSAVELATCGADETVRLWSAASDQALASLVGHQQRVNRLVVHPSGRYLASTSHDETWRLWDLETARELLVQDGHVSPVYGIAMQGDGSLVATGALNSVALLWDLRTGKQLWAARQHVKEVLSIDFSPSGYEFATGSADNVVRVFDVRQRALLHTIAAHQSLVVQVRYDRAHGDYLISGGYDKKLNVWCMRGDLPTLAATLAGHEGKIMGFDATSDDARIVTASFDRTFKIWHA